MLTEHLARRGSKTARREYRSSIRAVLGTTRDPAPDALDALAAARHLGALLDAATAGRYGIAVYDFATQRHLPPAEAAAILRARLAANQHVPA